MKAESIMNYEEYSAEIAMVSSQDNDANKKLAGLNKILERLAKELTRDAAMQFSNLFSRIVYIAKHYKLPKQLEWQLQNLRVRAYESKRNKEIDVAAEYGKHEKALTDFVCFIESREYEDDGEEALHYEVFEREQTSEEVNQKKHLRVQIKEIDRSKRQLICEVEHQPGAEITVQYGVSNVNDVFNDSVELFWEGAQLNLIDYTEDRKGNVTPKMIVLEPDYLIDASAVAECFHDFCTTPMHFFRNRFETVDNRSYILLGNLANFFLDELIFAEDHDSVSFNDTFLESFKQSPFEYTSCEDIASRAGFGLFWDSAKTQFSNIKRVILDDFPEIGIKLHNCTLEPSFFSEKYGFQGRLDLLHKDNNQYKIIELKSGKLPYPAYDMGKIADNHRVQTAVYRMMIDSVFGAESRDIDAAILYSSGVQPGSNLRFAADYQNLNKDIINMRNHLVANEHELINGDNGVVEGMFERLFNTTSFSKPNATFYTKKIEMLEYALKQCSAVELAYFYRYIRFISREIYLQKIGDTMHDSPAGVAALWNSDFSLRAEALDVLYDLSISSIDISGKYMVVTFDRNNESNEIANFREGEICIVYPRNEDNDTVLNKQILKGSISKINKDCIEVTFRHKQRNQNYFGQNKYWAIEHDSLDTSNNSMFRSLFSFLNASQQKRDILLGLSQPTTSYDEGCELQYPENVIRKAIDAEDYFLIVGPPGTGKTSIFARRLIEEYYAQPDTNILVLAYTNRAVDELCDAINAAFGVNDGCTNRFIRIGTELSCDERYRDQLLQNIAAKAEKREDLRSAIDKTRIFVSTVASINGKKELFNLKDFDVAIIDEASQILEPQIIGLLPLFGKFIMIGDHNQLPAIVLQNSSNSIIQERELVDIGITNCADSLFERLMRTAVKNGWDDCHAQLTVQGRMHNDIAAFPSSYFYPARLLPANDWQSEDWQSTYMGKNDLFADAIATKRLVFFSTERMTHSNTSHKTNENEANIVVSIIESLKQVYEHDGREFSSKDIGIIAPYRNQIALIKHKLQKAGIPKHEDIMVDTVERFQGSQRNVIIISFCINMSYQLNFLSNLNEAGNVDRKLNVSITRARQQMFLVGNARILQTNPIYATLLDFMNSSIIKLQ